MDVSDVKASTSSGTVHGVVVGESSPVKTSSKNKVVKYFDGRFSDGSMNYCTTIYGVSVIFIAHHFVA